VFDDLARSVPLIGLAYVIGCIATGYYLVRLRTGVDVRQQGSGSSGATNAMRVLGRGAFATVFAIDLAKGALAIALARWFDLDTVAVALAGVAVIAGHIWPVQLGFQGGKGVATAFGAALAFDAWIALAALLIAGTALALGVRFVMAGLIGTALAPVVALAAGRSGETVVGLALMAVLVLLGHRRNIAGVLFQHESVLRRGRTRPGKQGRRGAALAKGEPS
jgi:glycerol-3-phosphate acyltransferase PlsY